MNNVKRYTVESRHLSQHLEHHSVGSVESVVVHAADFAAALAREAALQEQLEPKTVRELLERDMIKSLSEKQINDVLVKLNEKNQALRQHLHEAATSLETISKQAGRDEYLKHMSQVCGYADSRARVARAFMDKPAEPVASEAALREELEISRVAHHETAKVADGIQQRLTAAEQRNAQLEPLKDCLVALESIIAAVDRCEEDQDVGLADVFTQRLEGAAREAIAKAKGLEPALVPFVFSDSPDGAAAEAVYLRQVAAHEVPGTSGQRLNQLANEGE